MVKIPLRLEELIPAAAMEKLFEVLQQPDISGKVREAIQRVGLHESSPLDKVSKAWHQARSWLDTLTGDQAGTAGPTTLNASGQLLSASLAGIPLAAAVAYGFAKGATGYQSASGVLSKADAAAKPLFGNRAYAWLASPADALRCLTDADISAAGTLLSRVDAVRIAGLGDIRSMLASGGKTPTEVGAANGVTADDWANALQAGGPTVVLASPNNISHGEAGTHRSQAITAAHAHGAKVIEVLADGVLCPTLTTQYGFPDPRQSLADGVDVVILPLNLLLGAPAGALVIGDSERVTKARRAAELSGALLGGAQLIAATLALQLSAMHSETDSGAVAQLLTNPENLKNRARRLAIQLTGIGAIETAVEHESHIALGPSPWNRYQHQSWGVRLAPKVTPSKEPVADMLRQLAQGEAKLGLTLQLVRQADYLLMDLRFVPPQHDHQLVALWGGGDQAMPATEDSQAPPQPEQDL